MFLATTVYHFAIFWVDLYIFLYLFTFFDRFLNIFLQQYHDLFWKLYECIFVLFLRFFSRFCSAYQCLDNWEIFSLNIYLNIGKIIVFILFNMFKLTTICNMNFLMCFQIDSLKCTHDLSLSGCWVFFSLIGA